MRIGVDIGGTFTDIVIQDDEGGVSSFKAESTPPDFSQGVLNGLDLAAQQLGITRQKLLGTAEHFVHGTTVTTNVVLTKTGERVGVITTAGFADTYPLARQYRGHEQDPAKVSHPTPLVSKQDIIEVPERIDYAGRVIRVLDQQSLERSIRELLDRGIKSIAICFLWSWQNPVHEQQAKAAVEKLAPDAYVSASFEACPVIGEYERTSTTVINAYAGPSLRRYAQRLDSALRESGLEKPILIMKSDGGPASIERAVATAAQTVYSGPAAGVVGAGFLGELIGERNLITFDMGGTSTDVSMVVDGEIQTTSEQFLERQAFVTPMLDVTSVGAGGGSLGDVTTAGNLRVGPESAGALPGPACYGKGGEKPAVTDANVVLGLIDPDYFLGGKLKLDGELSERAVAALGSQLELSPDRTAFGMFRVVTAVMADAIRLRTVFAGRDPRNFTLVSFGGAGGLHCAGVASELGIRKVIIPNLASVFSAFGLLTSDLVYSFQQSSVRGIAPGGVISPDDLSAINDIFHALDERAKAALAEHDVPESRRRLQHSIEMSYLGQILNFGIEAPAGELTAEVVQAMVSEYDDRYRSVYGPGAAAPELGYVFKTYKVVGVGEIARRVFSTAGAGKAKKPKPKSTRQALKNAETGEIGTVPVYEGSELAPGSAVDGPAILEYSDTTVLVPEDFTSRIDDYANVVIEAR